MEEQRESDLEKAARQGHRVSFLSDFWYFLRHNKKWWLLPILIVFLLMSALIWLTTGAAAPFIYSLF